MLICGLKLTHDGSVALVDGSPAATWRPKKSGHHFVLRVQPFEDLTEDTVADLREEAAALAAHRSCTTSDVLIT